jgi:hypothetical protein
MRLLYFWGDCQKSPELPKLEIEILPTLFARAAKMGHPA